MCGNPPQKSLSVVEGCLVKKKGKREQVFIGKQKDDLDGAAVPTPYLQQYFYANTTT